MSGKLSKSAIEALNDLGRSSSPTHRAYDEGLTTAVEHKYLEDGVTGSLDCLAAPGTSVQTADGLGAELIEDDLEEDESFVQADAAPSPPRDAAPGMPAEYTTISTPYVDELEEDETFLETRPSAWGPEELSPTRPDEPNAFALLPDLELDDEELPSLSQAYPQIHQCRTERDVTFSHLDLGRHASTSRIISGTAYNGKKVRFGRKRGNALVGASINSSAKDPAALGRLALTLLETPIHALLDDLEKAASAKTLDATRTEARQEDAEPKAIGARSASKGKGKARQNDIWTDRYKPRLFTELLGDERTHRYAMAWLKEWDSCVFKNMNAAAVARKKSLKRARQENGAFGADKMEDAEDPLGRPQDKIMLLTGPPGLGKTTLAHVIATQAGYQVMEINASDDRTAKVVQDKIKTSLESRALTSLGSLASSKPTCLIIDEIDGAGGGDAGFIKTLVRLVQEGGKTGRGKGKAKKEAQPLQRPIICICNDLYAPALRPLRAMARIVRFHAPSNGHLIKRLRTICEQEGLKADHKSLTMLVEVAEGDMRSCLNTLQIIRAQTDTLDEKVIRSTSLGLKDTATSVSAVWDKLFKIPAKKRQRGVEQIAEGKYVKHLVNDITTCGEYDKLAQTCFESYLSRRAPADGMQAVTRALEWLEFYDGLDRRLRTDREYDIMPYIPYAFVAWNPLFAAVSNKTPDWPKVDYDMYLKRLAHQEIADTVRKALPLGLKSTFTGPEVASELIPALVRIVSPDLKPVNQQLVKGEDKAVLRKLVKVMVDLGINYVPDRNEDGQTVFKLEPQLDVFIHYDGKRAPDVPMARFNLRQLISKELEAESVRRSGGDAGAGSDGTNKASGKSISALMDSYKARPADEGKSSKDGPAVDFFGRPIVRNTAPVDENAVPEIALPVKKKAKVMYKYHEGFSNAVRVNVKVTELFRV